MRWWYVYFDALYVKSCSRAYGIHKMWTSSTWEIITSRMQKHSRYPVLQLLMLNACEYTHVPYQAIWLTNVGESDVISTEILSNTENVTHSDTSRWDATETMRFSGNSWRCRTRTQYWVYTLWVRSPFSEHYDTRQKMSVWHDTMIANLQSTKSKTTWCIPKFCGTNKPKITPCRWFASFTSTCSYVLVALFKVSHAQHNE